MNAFMRSGLTFPLVFVLTMANLGWSAYLASHERSLGSEITLARVQLQIAEQQNEAKHGLSLADRAETKQRVETNAAVIAGLRRDLDALVSRVDALKPSAD